jgi:hypothetical protein
MIKSLVASAPFQGHQILGTADDAENLLVSPSIPADSAKILFRKVEALAAKTNFLFDL